MHPNAGYTGSATWLSSTEAVRSRSKAVLRRGAVLASFLSVLTAAQAATTPPIPVAAASAVFARAQSLCSADGGRLWGVSLCVPMMLADPRTHQAIADVPLPGAKRTGAYYRFELPAGMPIANAPFQYDGIRFAQVMWPLTGSADRQAVTLMHESFHVVQPKLGFIIKGNRSGARTISGDPALDTEGGRIWLRGELHALHVALTSNGAARKRALTDALELRAYRHAILPSTVIPEHQLDIIEGLAESTAIDVALPPARRVPYALKDMSFVESTPSYGREFCYAIGPAYSELLDAAEPSWRRRVTMNTSIAGLAARAYGITVVTPSLDQARTILSRYGGATIMREEAARETRQEAREVRYRAEFVTGPTLRLPMTDFRIGFNPMNVDRFGRTGSVYHQLTVSAPWGRIVVLHGDAMINGAFSALTVAAPSMVAGSKLHGPGWLVRLSPGARIVPDRKKPGSYTITFPLPPHHALDSRPARPARPTRPSTRRS